MDWTGLGPMRQKGDGVDLGFGLVSLIKPDYDELGNGQNAKFFVHFNP